MGRSARSARLAILAAMSTTTMGRRRAARSLRARARDARRPSALPILGLALAALLGFGTLVAAGSALLAGTYVVLASGLPDPHLLGNAELSAESIVLDRTGTVELARFGVRREMATWDDLSPTLVDATTAIEDKTFWTNSGFDLAAVVSAGLATLGGDARGASTITQQLVRARLLDPALVADPARVYERKVKEVIQSIRLTQAFPGEAGKRAIITAYLNLNFYGDNDYGVRAAASDYFGVSDLHRLTLAQAAILAAIPQSPTQYDLVRNAVPDATGRLVVPPDAPIVQRRNLILDLMASGRTPLTGSEYGAADYAAAKASPVVLAPRPKARRSIAPQFVQQVRAELAARVCGPAVPTCPELERGGFRIVSTLDARLQGLAARWVGAATIVPNARDPVTAARRLGLAYQPWMANLRGKQVNDGALVALDYQTGEILAYVGSADYYSTRSSARFQPQFDVLSQGWRQAGSAFKPFNYVTGFDSGKLTPSTMLMDVSTDFGGGYRPHDADQLERGPVRVTDALRFSLNIPAVRAQAIDGIGAVFDTARRAGIRFRTARPLSQLSLTLGTDEVHPLDLTTGYGTLANAGRYVPHTTILRVLDAAGRDVVPAYSPPTGTRAVSPGAAYLVTNILEGNTNPDINPFWGQFELLGPNGVRRPATLKTGTNNDARDLNAYGYIAPPSAAARAAGAYALVAGAWNGNSDDSVVSTAKHPLYSIDVTTYVWQGFMQAATHAWPITRFERAPNVVKVAVDPWTGLLPAAGGPSVDSYFIAGTQPTTSVDSLTGASCATALFAAAGYEARFPAWLAADLDWLARAAHGTGVVGSNKDRTAYFYEPGFQPYGPSWGLLSSWRCGGTGARGSPSASNVPPGDRPPIVAVPGPGGGHGHGHGHGGGHGGG